jgi:hypothetical protein
MPDTGQPAPAGLRFWRSPRLSDRATPLGGLVVEISFGLADGVLRGWSAIAQRADPVDPGLPGALYLGGEDQVSPIVFF